MQPSKQEEKQDHQELKSQSMSHSQQKFVRVESLKIVERREVPSRYLSKARLPVVKGKISHQHITRSFSRVLSNLTPSHQKVGVFRCRRLFTCSSSFCKLRPRKMSRFEISTQNSFVLRSPPKKVTWLIGLYKIGENSGSIE